MPDDPRADYRRRVYASYVTGREEPLAPESVAGLRPRLPYLRALVRRHFPADRNSRILDLGCGHGALLFVLHTAGYRNATGVDGSPEQVAAAQRLGIEGVFEGDVMHTLADTPDASVDIFVAFDIIEHFGKDELVALVDEVHRVLRPSGSWLIHVPNSEGPLGARMRYSDFTHEIALTRTSLSQLLRVSGFTRIACFEDRPVPHGPISAFRAVAWMMIRFTLLFSVAVETGDWDPDAVFTQNILAVAQRA